MNMRSAPVWLGLSSLALVGVVVVPSLVGAADADGFDGFIQSGTCTAPTDVLRVELRSDGPHDITPYVALDPDGEPVTLGYYGAPDVPGFGLAAIYTDQQFSMVMTDAQTGEPAACGDLLQPDVDRYSEAGVAVVQLLPVGSSSVHGLAALERVRLQRGDDVMPTRARIVLSTEDVDVPAPTAEGFDGYIQSGPCSSPSTRVRLQLRSRGEHDVKPFLAQVPGADEPVTVAYHGAPGAPGFGIATTYTNLEFSLVISDTDSGGAVACGAILEPDDGRFTEAGLALVRLSPLDGSGVDGFALIERAPLEREVDVTPTRVRILLFAPPVTAD